VLTTNAIAGVLPMKTVGVDLFKHCK